MTPQAIWLAHNSRGTTEAIVTLCSAVLASCGGVAAHEPAVADGRRCVETNCSVYSNMSSSESTPWVSSMLDACCDKGVYSSEEPTAAAKSVSPAAQSVPALYVPLLHVAEYQQSLRCTCQHMRLHALCLPQHSPMTRTVLQGMMVLQYSQKGMLLCCMADFLESHARQDRPCHQLWL